MPEVNQNNRGRNIDTEDGSFGTRRVSPLTYSSVTPDEMRGLTNFVRDYECASPEKKESMIHELANELCAGEGGSGSDKSEYGRYTGSPEEMEIQSP